MKSRKLINNDFVIENGTFATAQNSVSVRDYLKTRLQLYLGELFLHTNYGMPYFQKIFLKPVNLANTESIIKSEILKTTGVKNLLSFESSYTQNQRSLSITFSYKDDYDNVETITISI